MRVKNIHDEDFQDYKKPSMFIATCQCDWKCCIEQGISNDVCQNSETHSMPDIVLPNKKIIERYNRNKITSAIIFGGLEPMLQFNEMLELIKGFRKSGVGDDIVIYTGYYPNEVEQQITELKQYSNIIIKFGRYVHNSNKRHDEVLGVELASENQYAVKIS